VACFPGHRLPWMINHKEAEAHPTSDGIAVNTGLGWWAISGQKRANIAWWFRRQFYRPDGILFRGRPGAHQQLDF
jgi:hypothetical protein